jgi:hypothetical protein
LAPFLLSLVLFPSSSLSLFIPLDYSVNCA